MGHPPLQLSHPLPGHEGAHEKWLRGGSVIRLSVTNHQRGVCLGQGFLSSKDTMLCSKLDELAEYFI